jgi:four helix bundle protein
MPNSSPRAPRTPISHFSDLIVWQKAKTLAVEIYRATADLPPAERYVLSQQLRRSGLSVPANIAEGHGRMNNGDFARHLSIARGSLAEVETLLVIGMEVQYFTTERVAPMMALADESSRMLAVLIRRLGRAGPKR